MTERNERAFRLSSIAEPTVAYYDEFVDDVHAGIPFSDAPPGRPGRHRRRRLGEGTGRSALALLLVLAVFVGGGLGAWWGYGEIRDRWGAPDYSGPGSGEAIVQIKEGDTVTAIANTLYKADVVKSAKAFVEAAADDDRSQGLQPGTYKLRKKMEASAALAMLLDRESRLKNTITIPEGKSVKQTLAIISSKTRELAEETGLPLAIPLEALQAAADKPAELGVPAWAAPDPNSQPVLEGFLFPATYEITPGTDAKSLLTMMVKQANDVLVADRFEEQAAELSRKLDINLTAWDLLKVASLLEGEVIPEDFPKAARVVYNRIAQGIELRFDSTSQYWLELNGRDRQKLITNDVLKNPNNPYSTTLHQGLPPTPIANPRKEALDAAANPADGPWLYFVVVDEEGRSAFTHDQRVHDFVNKPKCRAIGRCE